MTDIEYAQVRRLDLTLLLVFVELMRHRKLTIVAQRLGQTQSAISHSLKRMRDVFGDELFIRRPAGVEPTARALALLPNIERIIGLAQEALWTDGGFDPRGSARTVRIGALDYDASLFAAPLTRILRREAPSMRLSIRVVARQMALDALTDSSIDIAIGYQPAVPDSFIHAGLYDETYVVVMRQGHERAAATLTLDAYLKCEHLLVSIAGGLHGVVDEALARMGLSRNVITALPMFLPALATVSETDLIATVPRRLALRNAARFGLLAFDPPLLIRPFSVSQVIHRRSAHDPGLAWIRSRLQGLTDLIDAAPDTAANRSVQALPVAKAGNSRHNA